jgi:hypothetical protein
MEDDMYTNSRSTRSSDRVVSSGLTIHDLEGLGSPHAPTVRRRPPYQAHREHTNELPKRSMLAGLAGLGKGMNRVSEWRHFVEPGAPEGDRAQSVAG